MNITRLLSSPLIAAIGLIAPASAQPTPRQESPQPVVFYAMGDVPYTVEEEAVLQNQIAALPHDGRFVIHVGDIKAGEPPCDEGVYANVSGILRACATPIFIIPGDNEWNDCVKPEQGWRFWQDYFGRFDQNWPHRLPVFRQLEREENFSMVTGGVLFVAINLVGGRVQDADEWKIRHQQNLQWVRRNVEQFGAQVSSLVLFGHANPVAKHDDFFVPFNQIAQTWGKPILYLHGDGHRWIEDRPFAAKNILRVQVDQGGKAPPIKVTVTQDATQPFQFDRRK